MKSNKNYGHEVVTVTQIPHTAQAVKVTKDNRGYIAEVVGKIYPTHVELRGDNTLMIGSPEWRVPADVDDWVVFSPNGTLVVMSPDVFGSNYQPQTYLDIKDVDLTDVLPPKVMTTDMVRDLAAIGAITYSEDLLDPEVIHVAKAIGDDNIRAYNAETHVTDLVAGAGYGVLRYIDNDNEVTIESFMQDMGLYTRKVKSHKKEDQDGR